jgi:hypothetical protein
MKLLAYLIDGNPVGESVRPWIESDLNGNPPFVSSENSIPGYTDISSISNWYIFSSFSGLDYLSIRSEISKILFSLVFDDLINSEKIIVSKLFLVEKTERDQVLTGEEQKEAWDILVESSLYCRSQRWGKSKSYISYFLSPSDSSDLAFDTSELCQNYINYNIIDYSTNGKDGIYDFIEGTSGYLNSGFPSKSYWTQEYQDNIISILKTGN